MLYSIIPPEIVFDEWDGAELETYQQITLGGRQVIIQPIGEKQMKIVQLISSDPADFLNARFQPGSVFEFTPEIFAE